jgi:hypothetical protein
MAGRGTGGAERSRHKPVIEQLLVERGGEQRRLIVLDRVAEPDPVRDAVID